MKKISSALAAVGSLTLVCASSAQAMTWSDTLRMSR